LGEELLGGTPQCRGYGVEHFEVRKELCTEGMNQRRFKELGVGVNARNLGLNEKWG